MASPDGCNVVTDGAQSDPDEQPPVPQHFDFVVFYSVDDRNDAYRIAEYLEQTSSGKFKGFLDDRDGFAARTEIENLDFALENCKAYIFLISKSFLECKFRLFKMNTSLYTSVTDPKFTNRLLPLLLDVDHKDMPSSLRIIQGIPYYPDDDIFWGKLMKSLEAICASDISDSLM